jgi:hypothetical protein
MWRDVKELRGFPRTALLLWWRGRKDCATSFLWLRNALTGKPARTASMYLITMSGQF